jgi:predicted dehydrogenase
VADPQLSLAEEVAGEFGARVFSDFTEFLEEVDAVVISTPNFMHAEQAVACAQAGKHVWIEKPMALSISDAERVVEAVEKAKVKSFVGFSVRFDPTVSRMSAEFESGVIGDIQSIWSRRLAYWPGQPGRGWRADYEKSGGVIHELLTHEIDWMTRLAGIPKAVYCRKAAKEDSHPRANDHIWLTLDFGSATGALEGSCMAKINDYYRGMSGTKGSLYTAHYGQKLIRQTEKDKSEELTDLVPFDKHGHFLDVIEGKCESVADARWGAGIVRIAEKSMESAIAGQAVLI